MNQAVREEGEARNAVVGSEILGILLGALAGEGQEMIGIGQGKP
jgi:hypothetical protein